MNLITENHLQIELSMPSKLIYFYEQMGMPYILVGGLKRYSLKKVRHWLTGFVDKKLN